MSQLVLVIMNKKTKSDIEIFRAVYDTSVTRLPIIKAFEFTYAFLFRFTSSLLLGFVTQYCLPMLFECFTGILCIPTCSLSLSLGPPLVYIFAFLRN